MHWAKKVKPGVAPVDENGDRYDDTPYYTESELNDFKSTVKCNAAMAHMLLKNWGHVRADAKEALEFNDKNVKASYRLAKAYQMLQKWEEAGDAIDSGLIHDGGNKELINLRKVTERKVCKARLQRQKRERERVESTLRVKMVWKHCKENNICLGRIPLVSSVTDDEGDDGKEESRWHHHHPHTGKLPQFYPHDEGWVWPCMFLYPSHQQSDFIESFSESDMLAYRMAEVCPEIEDEDHTNIPWDYNNEFECSNLAVYFEVQCREEGAIIHPEYVEPLKDQGAAMRFFESSRALKGDEGLEMGNVARCVERKLLHNRRKVWKKNYGSLWSKPDPCPVVRVHPAATLFDVITDSRMVIPNFLVTFIIFPEKHPAHQAFLKEHTCLGIIEGAS